MQFSSIILALAGASTTFAAALPAPKSNLMERQVPVCTGLSGSAVCCATDVLGLADLDCAAPPQQPTSVQDFTDICAAIGQRARCCALPIVSPFAPILYGSC